MQQPIQHTLDQVLTLDEGARQADMSYWRFLRAVKRGELVTVTLPGGRIGVVAESVQAFALRRQEK